MLRRHFALSVSFLIICCTVRVLSQTQVTAGSNVVPPLVKFSGVLNDGNGKPLAGTVGVTFSLYKDEQGGSPLWLETQNVQPDQSGHYSVMLGSTTSQGLPGDVFISGEARWVGVQPQGQQEQPRVLLSSVPYALKAMDAQTIGGLRPSAFVLATPPNSGSSAQPPSGQNPNAPPLGGSGTANYIPIWTDSTGDLGNSVLFQSGTGAKAKVGIGTTKPASTLDVKGGGTIRGLFSLPATGTATASAGFNSQPIDQVTSVFNSGTSTAVSQTFQWQAEPVGNNTSTTTGSLNLLFGQGTSKLTETGLNIASNGQITFATGQTFPGTGNGTITGVSAGTDLTGGGTSGTVTLNVDTTKVPQLNTPNTFTGNQTVNGNLSATGVVTGSTFQIGSNLFAFGSYNSENAFLGFAGNTTSGGTANTAVGFEAFFSNTTGYSDTVNGADALFSNTTGNSNTASGYDALYFNTTGNDNTASGATALQNNSTGSGNTADGFDALFSNTTGGLNTASGINALANNTTGTFNTANGAGVLLSNTTGAYNTAIGSSAGLTGDKSSVTGSNNTFLGSNSAVGTGTLNNATAIGASAEVTASNALVLGSISGVNGATANTNVGIGTTAPASTLDVHGTGNFTGLITFAAGQTFPGTGTITGVTPGTDLTGGGSSGNVTLNVDTTKVVTGVVAGTDLTGGGSGGMQTLSLDTTKVPQLAANNTFTGNQMVNGNLSATGMVSGSGFQIGSNLFAFGNYGRSSAFLGFAGNTTTSGFYNTAIGVFALMNDTIGFENTATGYNSLALTTGDSSGNGRQNTATGVSALYQNQTGNGNTATGAQALDNSTGSWNTATGIGAGSTADNSPVTGGSNTFLGSSSTLSTGNLSYATAIGANAEVSANYAMVLGSINGVNNALASTNVGIGITAPTYLLQIGNTGGDNNNFLRVEGPVNKGSGGMAASFGGNGAFAIDAPDVAGGRFYVAELGSENGVVGIGCTPSTLCAARRILAIGQGAGHAIADGWDTYSSRRWKTNIQTLQGALTKVEQLRGVSYDLKKSGKHQIGVIAEEVGKVVPEVVSYEENGKDAQGVDYSRLTALLIEAVKQQQREIASQRAQISKLRDKDTRQARVLQNVVAQTTILQSKLAQLDGNVGGQRLAETASARTPSGQTVAAKAQF